MSYLFTPKKFLNMLSLNERKLSEVIKYGADRSYFIPRYKRGPHKSKELEYSYRKRIENKALDKVAEALVKMGLSQDKESVIRCFANDNYDALLPKDLL